MYGVALICQVLPRWVTTSDGEFGFCSEHRHPRSHIHLRDRTSDVWIRNSETKTRHASLTRMDFMTSRLPVEGFLGYNPFSSSLH